MLRVFAAHPVISQDLAGIGCEQNRSDSKTRLSWMGHEESASTMICLKAVPSKELMARANFSELAALVKSQGGGMHFLHSTV